MSGGDTIAQVLKNQGVRALFTLCGGHISPILTASRKLGIDIIDVRDEATAVFAADAVSRLSGVPGVAAVTAGPGVTNAITAVKNAQMAQSPLVLLGGSAPTLLKKKGALQDIDQITLLTSITKSTISLRRTADIGPKLERAFVTARSGVPGPVFVECPIDLIYDEALVRKWYATSSQSGRPTLRRRAVDIYLQRHLRRLFAPPEETTPHPPPQTKQLSVKTELISRAAALIAKAQKPVVIVGSQATLDPAKVDLLAGAVAALGLPVYLTGMARGLLGKSHPLKMHHQRKRALQQADLVILAGMPFDFRLGYGRAIARKTKVISINRSRPDLTLNRKPTLGLHADPCDFLCQAANMMTSRSADLSAWLSTLHGLQQERESEIESFRTQETEYLNPLDLLFKLEQFLERDTVIVGDGGDFVGSASYILRPRGPLRWLDPGVFGTLGVGAGFALGAKLCRPEAEVWIIYGDGAAGYSLQEFDTFVRHGLPVIALVGNDASWAQIARDQTKILNDGVATVLRRTDYHTVAEGFGGKGFLLADPDDTEAVFSQARQAAKDGHPVLINAQIGKTAFREGSISM